MQVKVPEMVSVQHRTVSAPVERRCSKEQEIVANSPDSYSLSRLLYYCFITVLFHCVEW